MKQLRKDHGARVGLLIAAAVLVVVAVVILPLVLRVGLPDANKASAADIGYTDFTVRVKYSLNGQCSVINGVVQPGSCQVGAILTGPAPTYGVEPDEHLNNPTAPATVFRFPGTFATTSCTGKVTLTVTGPGVGSGATTSSEQTFDLDATVAFPFGHLHFTAKGTHNVHVVVNIRGCPDSLTDTEAAAKPLLTVDRSFTFDGDNST